VTGLVFATPKFQGLRIAMGIQKTKLIFTVGGISKKKLGRGEERGNNLFWVKQQVRVGTKASPPLALLLALSVDIGI